MPADQDYFRTLLATPGPSTSSSGSRSQTKQTKQSILASEPSFKPRKVSKKNESLYRDRAAERRIGVAGDFAGVEAVLEAFEKQHANDEDKQMIEEQRRYLGGDSEHSVLVKGLDFALLEQLRAKESTTTVDDDSLENAFQETARPQKRTREEIIRDLKAKRMKVEVPEEESTSKHIDELKSSGKFKPIGAPAVSKQKIITKKMKKTKGEASKRQVDAKNISGSIPTSRTGNEDVQTSASSTVAQPSKESAHRTLETEYDDRDIDIFADAGDYEGLNLDDDDEAEKNTSQQKDKEVTDKPLRSWFLEDTSLHPEAEEQPQHLAENKSSRGSNTEDTLTKGPVKEQDEQEDHDEKPRRLVPLSSSSIPSIRDILTMDEALEAEEKRKAKKEKRKAGGGNKEKDAEAKINRDYQKLKSYTEQKEKKL